MNIHLVSFFVTILLVIGLKSLEIQDFSENWELGIDIIDNIVGSICLGLFIYFFKRWKISGIDALALNWVICFIYEAINLFSIYFFSDSTIEMSYIADTTRDLFFYFVGALMIYFLNVDNISFSSICTDIAQINPIYPLIVFTVLASELKVWEESTKSKYRVDFDMKFVRISDIVDNFVGGICVVVFIYNLFHFKVIQNTIDSISHMCFKITAIAISLLIVFEIFQYSTTCPESKENHLLCEDNFNTLVDIIAYTFGAFATLLLITLSHQYYTGTESPRDLRKLIVFMERVPLWLRKGPWHPSSHIVVFICSTMVVLTAEDSINSYRYSQLSSVSAASTTTISSSVLPPWFQLYRLLIGAYGVILSMLTVYSTGGLVLASYTMTSWNLMSIRLLASFGAWYLNSSNLQVVADTVLFPALVGCSITVTVWWLVLVPIIYFVTSGQKEHQEKFTKFNLSFPLLNVHLLNLPIIAIEFFANNQKLVMFDLWMACLVCVIYCIFYLNVLDANGLHFYIPFTPRTAFSGFTYLIMIAICYGNYLFWNNIISSASIQYALNKFLN